MQWPNVNMLGCRYLRLQGQDLLGIILLLILFIHMHFLISAFGKEVYLGGKDRVFLQKLI